MDRHLTHSTCAAEFLKGRVLDRCASKLFKIIEHELPTCSSHCYADDTQLYLSFKPDSTSQDQVLLAMENCIEKIRKWMIHDKLLINGSKTELIVIQ